MAAVEKLRALGEEGRSLTALTESSVADRGEKTRSESELLGLVLARWSARRPSFSSKHTETETRREDSRLREIDPSIAFKRLKDDARRECDS